MTACLYVALLFASVVTIGASGSDFPLQAPRTTSRGVGLAGGQGAGEDSRLRAEAIAAGVRRQRRLLETVDVVDLSQPGSEEAHANEGQRTETGGLHRRWRATQDGWFGYQLEVVPNHPALLVCTFVDRGGGHLGVAVTVNGQPVRGYMVPPGVAEVLEVEFPIPEQAFDSRESVTVRFHVVKGRMMPGLLEARMVRVMDERPRPAS